MVTAVLSLLPVAQLPSIAFDWWDKAVRLAGVARWVRQR